MNSNQNECLRLDDRPEHKLTRKEKALFSAVRKDDARKVQELIRSGVNVNALQTPKGMFEFDFTPLHWAAFSRNVEVVKLLLGAGADVHAEVRHLQALGHPGETPLNWACGFRRSQKPVNLKVVELLLAHGANPNHRMTKSRQSVFEASILKGRIELVRLLLSAGAYVNPEVTGVSSPLMIAADVGDFEIAQELLQRGADPSYSDSIGRTALMEASEGGHEVIVKLLLDRGADVNARDRLGETALTLVATRIGDCYDVSEGENRLRVIQYLTQAGADINTTDPHGYTPLDLAARNPLKDHGSYGRMWFGKGAEFLRSLGARHSSRPTQDNE